jgi:hypothetical protein
MIKTIALAEATSESIPVDHTRRTRARRTRPNEQREAFARRASEQLAAAVRNRPEAVRSASSKIAREVPAPSGSVLRSDDSQIVRDVSSVSRPLTLVGDLQKGMAQRVHHFLGRASPLRLFSL